MKKKSKKKTGKSRRRSQPNEGLPPRQALVNGTALRGSTVEILRFAGSATLRRASEMQQACALQTVVWLDHNGRSGPAKIRTIDCDGRRGGRSVRVEFEAIWFEPLETENPSHH